jgi:uncharacterized SAM-binding protein YcdF (DUF218 family)
VFFVASKLLWFIAEPFDLLLAVALIGVALSFGPWPRFGRGLCATAVIVLAIASISPLGSILLRTLENRFRQPPPDLPAPTGIVVLGGALDEDLTLARHQPTFGALAARLTEGIILSRRYPQARLIFTGGSSKLTPNGNSEATGVRDLWLALGVPPDRMTFEGTSRDTWENASNTHTLVHPKPGDTWLLVTSAWHMPRAVGVFRRAGFAVIPYPVDYNTFGDARDFAAFHLGFGQLIMLDYALHEWIGLIAYHLTGKTDAWFPAP